MCGVNNLGRVIILYSENTFGTGLFLATAGNADDVFCLWMQHVNMARSILVVWLECLFLDTEVDGSNPGISMLCP